MMDIVPARLEYWLRDYYFHTEIDIGSSGVESLSLAALRELIGLTQEDLDRVVFCDSRSCGSPELRAAIARRWGTGDPEQVMATHGSSEAIYLLMNALLCKGDEVVVLAPAYQPLFSIAEAIGSPLKSWHLMFERHFVPDLQEAKNLIGPHTRMVVVNFPHNPTGTSLTLEQQEDLINITAKAGAYLVWDAAFAELTYDSPPLPNPNRRYERAISLGTLSKAFGLPGLRVGWCLAAPSVLARCVHLRDYITLHLSPLVELIAQRAIERADTLLSMRLPQARRNRELLAGWVGRHRGLVEWVRPQGGVCAFLRLCGLPDVEAFCHQLASVHRVLLVPGTCFGHADFVRLGFGGPTAEFKAGLSCLSRLLRIETANAHGKGPKRGTQRE